MDIFDIWREKRHTKEFEDGSDKALDMFIKQKTAIEGIKGSEGYKLLKSYFRSQVELSMELVMKSNKNNEKAKGRYEVASEFLQFLENLESNE